MTTIFNPLLTVCNTKLSYKYKVIYLKNRFGLVCSVYITVEHTRLQLSCL